MTKKPTNTESEPEPIFWELSYLEKAPAGQHGYLPKHELWPDEIEGGIRGMDLKAAGAKALKLTPLRYYPAWK